MNKEEIESFLLGYSGYCGGDIGSPERPSIWCCGIEWGGDGINEKAVLDYFESRDWEQIGGFEPDDGYIKARYNISLCKLLCAIQGGQVEDYEQFAEQHQVWHKGAKTGYLKLNLYPLWFKDTDENRWTKELSDLLSFRDKNEYLNWCQRHRFPVINELAQKHQPRLVICFGLSYENEFHQAFSDDDVGFDTELIDGLKVKWKRNKNGTIVVVLPFPNIPNGLLRNQSIQLIGGFLASLL